MQKVAIMVLRERTCCENDEMIIFVTLFVGDNGGMA